MATPVLIKTQSLLNKGKGYPFVKHNFVSFFSLADGDDVETFREVTIDLPTWEDLGRPDTITVTIEPGDKLNDG